ncbi:MAG: DUF6383 domain-containing protein [Prevotella sp.]|jgi:hypothetical protein|nr:DUF6383 domain-containing protein [Prevotella sp.]
MKKVTFLTAAAVCLLSFTSAKAQAPDVSWEAEDFVGLGMTNTRVLPSAGGAGVSGGKYMEGVSKSNCMFYWVNVSEAGWYTLKVYYMVNTIDLGRRGQNFAVRVNEKDIDGVALPTTTSDSDNPETYDFSVYLNQGANLVRVGQGKIWGRKVAGQADDAGLTDAAYLPALDKFELYRDAAKDQTDPEPADVEDNPLGNGYEQNARTFLTDSNISNQEGCNYVMLPNHPFTVACETSPANQTVSALLDNDPATVFESTADVETFVISYPSAAGIFMLSAFAATNPQVIIQSIERSNNNGSTYVPDADDSNGSSNDYRWKPYNLFDNSKEAAVRTISAWTSTGEGKPTERYSGYTQYRVTIKRPIGLTTWQIPDFRLYGSFQNYVDLTESANGAGSYTISNFASLDGTAGLANAFDNGIGTKFSYQQTTYSTTDLYALTWEFTNYAKVTHYSLATAGTADLQRDAKSWKLEGSNDALAWVELDAVTDYTWYRALRYTALREIASPSIYKYYRLTATDRKSGTDKYVHISEFQLHGTLETNTGIGTLAESKPGVRAIQGGIIIAGAANLPLQVYNAAGQVIVNKAISGNNAEISLGKGLYLVRIGGQTVKVIVR